MVPILARDGARESTPMQGVGAAGAAEAGSASDAPRASRDGSFRIMRVPSEKWAPGQMTPFCSHCQAKRPSCHFCEGKAWAPHRQCGQMRRAALRMTMRGGICTATLRRGLGNMYSEFGCCRCTEQESGRGRPTSNFHLSHQRGLRPTRPQPAAETSSASAAPSASFSITG